MAQYICYDSAGKELKSMYQWDTNRVIVIDKLPSSISDSTIYIHLCNCRSPETYVMEASVEDNKCSVVVPNPLLMKPDNIILYVSRSVHPNEQITMQQIVIPVIPRLMPPEYIYQNDMKQSVADGLVGIGATVSLSNDGKAFGSYVII